MTFFRSSWSSFPCYFSAYHPYSLFPFFRMVLLESPHSSYASPPYFNTICLHPFSDMMIPIANNIFSWNYPRILNTSIVFFCVVELCRLVAPQSKLRLHVMLRWRSSWVDERTPKDSWWMVSWDDTVYNHFTLRDRIYVNWRRSIENLTKVMTLTWMGGCPNLWLWKEPLLEIMDAWDRKLTSSESQHCAKISTRYLQPSI